MLTKYLRHWTQKAGIVTALLFLHLPVYSITADSTLSAVTVFIDQGSRIHPGSTREDVVALLGPPARIEQRDVRNAHHPVYLDRVYTYFYDGMAIQIYQAVLSQKEFVVNIAVNTDRYHQLSPVMVGDSRDKIVRLLGTPQISHGDLMIYDEMQAGLGRVCLRMEDDKVQAILWQFYFD